MRCRDLLLCSVAFGLALGLATASAEESRPPAAFAVPPLSAAESTAAFAPVTAPPPVTAAAQPATAVPVAAAPARKVAVTTQPQSATGLVEPPNAAPQDAPQDAPRTAPYSAAEIAAAKARIDARVAAAEAEVVQPNQPSAVTPVQPLAAPPAAPAESAVPAATPPAAASPAMDVAAAPAGDAVRAAVAAKLAAPVARPDANRTGLAKFYALRDDHPVWIDGGKLTEAGRALVDRLGQADEDGLDARAYAVPGLASLGGATPEAAADAELGLSAALVAYAHDAASGRVDPKLVGRDIVADEHAPDPMQVLISLAIAADPAAVLDGYNPTQPQFLALKHKLAELRAADAAVAQAQPPLVPPGRTLKVGMVDARVAVLRSRLGVSMSDGDIDSDVYDEVLADAVRAFQRERRLKATGVLSPQTLAALNGQVRAPAVSPENDVIANMERWRWMPRELGASNVLVNVPDYRLRVTMDGTMVNESKVVVGKPDTPTPIFSDTMQFVVMNPSWNVPQSIIKNEYLPKLASDPNYLIRQGFVVTYRNNQMVVRQPPGERNALGHIKFMFPNRFSVYLHDTSSRSLFASDKRAFSHGCVRVDQPYKFAEVVMGAENGWTEQRVKKLVGGREQRIDLKRQLPVHIAYFTAFVDDGGELKRLDDIYGYNRRVLAALGLLR